MIRLIQMSSILSVAATAGLLGWVAIGAGGGPKPLAAASPAAQPRAEQAVEPKKDDADTVPLRGRVLTPDGQPAHGAAIYIGQAPFGWILDPVAHTDADGRFRFDPEPIWRNHHPGGQRPFDRKKAELMAVASGFGPVAAPTTGPDGAELALRLVPDDVPIRGRILDTQGRPVAGATVRVEEIKAPPVNGLDTLLESGAIDQDQPSAGHYAMAWRIKKGSEWTMKTIETGPDGRFRIDGAGRDRLVFLKLEGPGIGTDYLCAMTRVDPRSARPRPGPTDPYSHPRLVPLHGATFNYVASPGKPIEGVVRVKGTGRPLAGVHVSGLVAPDARARASADTDEEGRFRLDGLPKVASYHLYVRPASGQDYLPASVDLSDTDGLKPIPVTIDLLKGVAVHVRLIDRSTGKSVAGNSVLHVKLPSNPNEGHAAGIFCSFGPEGFRMIVPPGPGFFYGQAAGDNLPYTRARLAPADKGKGVGGEGDGEFITVILSSCHAYRIVDVPATDEVFNLDLELTRGTSRHGRLVDPEGKPVVGASAYGLGANWEVKTLDGASFEATALEPGKPRSVSFMHKGRRLAGAVALEPGDGPVEVRLAPCGSATGRLVDDEGRPVTGAYLVLLPLLHGGHPIAFGVGLWPQDEAFAVDNEGRFRVEGINPVLGVAVDIRVRFQPDVFLVPEKSREAIFRHLEADPGETVDLGEIRVTRRPKG